METRGIEGSRDFASLTDIILQQWSGYRTKQYKAYKGLKKESLRDNMTNVELALNTLAEVSTTEISRSENPKGFFENADIARRGGNIARQARQTKLASYLASGWQVRSDTT